MLSSLKKPFAWATATVKFGMFGFDTAIRIRSEAKAETSSHSKAMVAAKARNNIANELALLHDLISAIAANFVDADENPVAFAFRVFVQLRLARPAHDFLAHFAAFVD